MHKRLYIDEFISMISRKSFVPPKEIHPPPVEQRTKLQIKMKLEQATNQKSKDNKDDQKPGELSTILEKIYGILDQLKEQSDTNEQKDRSTDALTIPFLKLLRHHDTGKEGKDFIISNFIDFEL